MLTKALQIQLCNLWNIKYEGSKFCRTSRFKDVFLVQHTCFIMCTIIWGTSAFSKQCGTRSHRFTQSKSCMLSLIEFPQPSSSTLDGVLDRQSDFDWMLYKYHIENLLYLRGKGDYNYGVPETLRIETHSLINTVIEILELIDLLHSELLSVTNWSYLLIQLK